MVAIPPDLFVPPGQAGNLPREVGTKVAHEKGELEGVGSRDQDMEVRGQKGIAVDLEGMEALGPSQDTEDDVVEEHAGDQQGAPLEGALGDFDEASGVGNEPWHSHAKE